MDHHDLNLELDAGKLSPPVERIAKSLNGGGIGLEDETARATAFYLSRFYEGHLKPSLSEIRAAGVSAKVSFGVGGSKSRTVVLHVLWDEQLDVNNNAQMDKLSRINTLFEWNVVSRLPAEPKLFFVPLSSGSAPRTLEHAIAEHYPGKEFTYLGPLA
jgi:hypothetical protein